MRPSQNTAQRYQLLQILPCCHLTPSGRFISLASCREILPANGMSSGNTDMKVASTRGSVACFGPAKALHLDHGARERSRE